MSGLEPSFNDALCLFFWELHFLISWNLPGLASEHCHITPPPPHDFLFYLRTTESILVSRPTPAPPQRDGPTLSIPDVQSDCFKPGDFRRWNKGVKAFFCVFQKQVFLERKKKGIGDFFSQDLDTSN